MFNYLFILVIYNYQAQEPETNKGNPNRNYPAVPFTQRA